MRAVCNVLLTVVTQLDAEHDAYRYESREIAQIMASDAHRAAERAPFEVIKLQATLQSNAVPSAWTRALNDVDRMFVRNVTMFGEASGFYFLTHSDSGRHDANHKVLPGAFFDFVSLGNDGVFASRFTARLERVVVVRGTAPRAGVDDVAADPIVITLIDLVVFDATPNANELRETARHFVFCYGAPANYRCEVRSVAAMMCVMS